MIWAAFPGLNRPPASARIVIDVCIASAFGYLIALGWWDRDPPYAQSRGAPMFLEQRRGETNEVVWSYVDSRYCGEVVAYRSLLSSYDPNWQQVISVAPVRMDPSRPRPVQRVGTSEGIRVPRSFPVDPRPGALTSAYYQVDVLAACNWLQEWLPQRLWVRQRLPTIEWKVTNAEPVR
jgi:hypothetical protein